LSKSKPSLGSATFSLVSSQTVPLVVVLALWAGPLDFGVVAHDDRFSVGRQFYFAWVVPIDGQVDAEIFLEFGVVISLNEADIGVGF
jgi:hypothetical protein